MQQATALGLGAAVGAALGGNQDAIKQGAITSYNAETFNRQLHQSEQERIKELAKGDKEKARRLEIAACALVHCAEQIPADDPAYVEVYEKAKALETLGNTAEYAKERALLSKQTYRLSDSFGAGTELRLFNYNDTYKAGDKAQRFDSKYGVTTRVGGLAQTAGGVGLTTFGVGLCETGLGCAVGTSTAFYGIDNAYTGAKTVVTGKNQSTLGGALLSQVTGLSAETAELVYGLPSMVVGFNKSIASGRQLGITVSQKYKATNPHNPFLEVDRYGNEIYYRSMSKADYEYLLDTGIVSPTKETFISPLKEYSQKYDGILVKFKTTAGTSDSLQKIGVVGNSATQREVFPNMERAKAGWGINDQALFKLEGRRDGFNKGYGVVNTGLGQSEALEKFNNRIIEFEKIDKE